MHQINILMDHCISRVCQSISSQGLRVVSKYSYALLTSVYKRVCVYACKLRYTHESVSKTDAQSLFSNKINKK